MAAFAKSTFSHATYAAFRPTYPSALYNTVLAYHQGPRNLAVDLGCGHGLVARALAPFFTQVIGTDPSQGMLKTASESTKEANVSYQRSGAESIPFLKDSSVDMFTAAQAAHWFDYPKLWPEMLRCLKPGGTLAFWGYTDCEFPSYPKATKILREYAYGNSPDLMGPYWQRPGRTIVQEKLRAIKPLELTASTLKSAEGSNVGFCDVTRIEYEPGTNGPGTGKGQMFMQATMPVASVKQYVRTFSAYSGWKDTHPDEMPRTENGKGDIVDRIFDGIAEVESGWRDNDKEVVVEWGSGLILARKSQQ